MERKEGVLNDALGARKGIFKEIYMGIIKSKKRRLRDVYMILKWRKMNTMEER